VLDDQGTRQLPPPRELVIATHDSLVRHSLGEDVVPSSNYYTFYLDEAGEEMTDTCHSSPEEAILEAEHGFQIQPDQWEVVGQV
jgi:hypothetical protein